MNYQGTHFKKIYFRNFITTTLLENGKEKKNLDNCLPLQNWNDKDFDFSQPWITNKYTAQGYAVPTGEINNITVLDFDTMDEYRKACDLFPEMDLCYRVKTRRGYHVYFLYDDCIIDKKVKDVDVQNNNKFVIGPDTLVKRYNGQHTRYDVRGSNIIGMPPVLMDMYCKVDANAKIHRTKHYNTNINYEYEISDDQCREILDQIATNHREYFTDYLKWYTFTGIMKGIDKFALWDEYSEKYADGNYSQSKNLKIWKKSTNKIPFNHFCKILNIPFMSYHKQVPENEMYNLFKYDPKTTLHANTRYVSVDYEDFTSNDTIVIQSGTGTGKTTNVSKLCRTYTSNYEHCTVLSIVNLISLANQQKITFGKTGINLKMYNESKTLNPSAIMSNNSCICINSVWRLNGCDFRDKIVYIDEVYSLCETLTHSDTIQKQREVCCVLYKILTTCKKLVVSDAHIHNNVFEFMKIRLDAGNDRFMHYINSYKKFESTPATRYNDENEFYNTLEHKIMMGESCAFACDSKNITDKWFNKLYEGASVETQSKMLLYTRDTDTEIQSDWNGKIVFYTPKITTSVDIMCVNASEQFIYITGKSVSSIGLLQMATRTRNMTKLNYYSSARSNASLYESFKDCKKYLTEQYMINHMGFDKEDIECYNDEPSNCNKIEKWNLKMFIRNSYALDLYHTNALHFFEKELQACGFIVNDAIGTHSKMESKKSSELQKQSHQIKDEKYELLLDSFTEDNEDVAPSISIKALRERCALLNLSTQEQIKEYRDVIEDPTILDHFLNYNGLHKSFDHCEYKVRDAINSKMIAGLEKTRWFKIKYVHLLAKICGIEGNLFDMDSIQVPELTDENKKLVDGIKKLYVKRDSVGIDDYDEDYITALYKFMLDNLIKKLKVFKSVKCKKRYEERDKYIHVIDQEKMEKYNRLIDIMNHNSKVTPEYSFIEE